MVDTNNDWGMAFLLMLIIAAIFLGGVLVGDNSGEDRVANLWCISLGYDMGEYDHDMDNVVCKHVEIMEGE